MEEEEHIKSHCKSIQTQIGRQDTWLVSSIYTRVESLKNRVLKSLIEEHHISNFDPESFFTLHDYDDNHSWEPAEILKTYGMNDPSAKDVPQSKKDEILSSVHKLMDLNGDKIVDRDEWMVFCHKGLVLPDFGTGPGHHWDMEMEYEIHHWEK